MKKFLLFGLIIPMVYFTACKKCYHCQNTCQICTGIGSVGHDSLAYVTQVLCNDSFGTGVQYTNAVDSLIANGFACAATTSTYSQDYCVYKDGEQPYLNYYDKGGRVQCNLK